LRDLHKIGLDIKPENSVFDNKKGLMLIDMESAVPLKEKIKMTGGTKGYNAPERDGNNYCSPEKADMFSLGAVASVLMS
jgi:serine/threonine protein kinase